MPGSWESLEVMTDQPPVSIVWASNGAEGSGKSYFGLTAPSPIFVAAFDPFGMDRVDKQVKIGKDIRIGRYPFSAPKGAKRDPISIAATDTWNRFLDDYHTALGTARTILWDREDLAWELLRYASFGAQNDAPKEYGPLNDEYIGLIQAATLAHVNLGLLRGMKEYWVSKFDASKQKYVPHNTGELVPDGQKKIPDHVDITVAHQWNTEQRMFMTTIGKFPNLEYRDVAFGNMTFQEMALAAYPDSNPETWV